MNVPGLDRDVAHLRVDGGDTLPVERFVVDEAIMTSFELKAVVVTRDHDLDLASMVGRPASFELVTLLGVSRKWEGMCRHAELVSTGNDDDVATYEITIVPLLWALTQRRDYRIFQTRSELEIALEVLAEWGIHPEVRADAGSYPDRKYRVQYGESDFAFVSRMLEDIGVSYHFETDGDGTRMVLDDAVHTRDPRARPITYLRGQPTQRDTECATLVRVAHDPAPAAYTQRDVDYRRAADFPLLASARREAPGPLARAERFHYVPGAFVFRTDVPSTTPVADDRGVHRANLALGQRQVERRFEAKRSKARRVYFETTARDLRPGMTFRFAGHPRAEIGPDVTLLVVETRLTGEFPGAWSQSVEARFVDVPYRPPMRTPKPRASGVETATVVGPAGEEIHTDEHGRVRVHFHWDRHGGRDDKDSCWLPVSQGWGGSGYGSVNLPRIGQEVLVELMGGDVDRPIVMGRVYTSLQRLPWDLPANKTQSGLKSASSPATGGYNEIMFEDAAGKELMRIQAEKDRSSLVKNDCDGTVMRNRSNAVGNDESKVVGRDQTSAVRRNRTVAVDGDSEHFVGANDVALVGGDRAEITAGRRRLDTGHSYMSKVGNASSFFAMHENFIILQSPKVFINPNLTEAEIVAALESGTPPKTADEQAADAAAAAARREAQLQERVDDLRGQFAEDPATNPGYEAMRAAETPEDEAYHRLAGDVMDFPSRYENVTEQGMIDGLTAYGTDPDVARGAVSRLIDQGYP